jgi:hypothetical protein
MTLRDFFLGNNGSNTSRERKNSRMNINGERIANTTAAIEAIQGDIPVKYPAEIFIRTARSIQSTPG